MENIIHTDDNTDQLVNEEMRATAVSFTAIPSRESIEFLHKRAMQMMSTMVDFKELLMMNACAMKEIKTKFEVLDTEFNLNYHRNPINSISTRLKSISSIATKMIKLNLPLTLNEIENNIHDIAGVRVICSYIDDVFQIADALLRQDDVTLITKKDYITNPKPNGYRSLHLIVQIPVFFANHRKNISVEVQIRTIAMDFWASLEHQIKYKQTTEADEEFVAELKSCADRINLLDAEMLGLRMKMEAMTDIPTEEEELLERFSKFDMPIS